MSENMSESITRNEAIERFKAIKQRKNNIVSALEKRMKKEYEEKTGLEAKYFFAL